MGAKGDDGACAGSRLTVWPSRQWEVWVSLQNSRQRGTLLTKDAVLHRTASEEGSERPPAGADTGFSESQLRTLTMVVRDTVNEAPAVSGKMAVGLAGTPVEESRAVSQAC